MTRAAKALVIMLRFLGVFALVAMFNLPVRAAPQP
jgi:hypothetical protein